MEVAFKKLEKYFGAMAYSSNSIQFDLPSAKSLAKRYVTAYEIRKVTDILDAHYSNLRSDLIYDFTEILSVFIETKNRSYLTCSINGFSGLRELRDDWLLTLEMEREYNQLKSEGKDELGDLFKLLYAKRDIEDQLKDALEIIDRIEKYINSRVGEIKLIVEPLIS